MNNHDKLLVGMGLGLIMTGFTAIDTFLANRKMKKASMAVSSAAGKLSGTLDRCVVNVNRNGRSISAVSMITPGMVSQHYSK